MTSGMSLLLFMGVCLSLAAPLEVVGVFLEIRLQLGFIVAVVGDVSGSAAFADNVRGEVELARLNQMLKRSIAEEHPAALGLKNSVVQHFIWRSGEALLDVVHRHLLGFFLRVFEVRHSVPLRDNDQLLRVARP
jgi:hypothetical protein